MKTDEEGNTTISLYKDKLLEDTVYFSGEEMLKIRFSNFDDKMSIILLDRLKEHEFTNQRFIDGVKYVLDNSKYPNFVIADLLNFDKVLNLRTYEQIAKEQKEFGNTIWNYYNKVDIKGKCYYIHKTEAENNDVKLPEYKPKPATNKINIDRTNPGNNFSLSKDFSFIAAFNKIVEETGVGEKIPEEIENGN